MSNTTLVANQVAVFFIIILAGFFLVKLKLLKVEDSKVISMLVVYLITPCLIIDSFQMEKTPDITQGLILAAIAGLSIQIIMIIISYILKYFFNLSGIEQAAITYSNSGNLVIPLVYAVFGQEWVIYSTIYMAIQTILIWTHMKSLITEDKEFSLKKLMLNINMISIFIGMIFFFGGFSLPPLIGKAAKTLGETIGPLCMITAGMLLANVKKEDLKKYRRLPLVCASRLIVCPLVILGLLYFTKVTTLFENARTILLICFIPVCTCSASLTIQIAQVYDKDATYASVINAVTTVLCVISMPVFVLFFDSIL